jgi:hypothetical protein
MAVTERLAAALDERADGARPAPDALDRIRGRARHHQQVARLRTAGAVTVVAAVAVAAPVLLRGADRTSLTPPAATSAPAATPEPTASPTPTASASPLPAPAKPDEFVALTDDRALAIVSSRTGAVARVVTTFDQSPWSLDLAPDGRTALVTLPPPAKGECSRIVEVDVVSGAQRAFAEGGAAEYSPDGTSVAYDACPGDAIVVLRQLEGDDSDWVLRLDPAKHHSLNEAERVVVTYTTTMLVPVPWRDTLLHMASEPSEPEARQVRAGRAYRDGYVTESDVLFTLPDPVVAVAVGPNDEIVASAGDSMWVWDGTGKPVEIGKRYVLFGW